MSLVPAFSQKKTGICYAVAASQMAEAKLKSDQITDGKLLTNDSLSPLGNAIISKFLSESRFVSTGVDSGFLDKAYEVSISLGALSRPLFINPHTISQWKLDKLKKYYDDFQVVRNLPKNKRKYDERYYSLTHKLTKYFGGSYFIKEEYIPSTSVLAKALTSHSYQVFLFELFTYWSELPGIGIDLSSLPYNIEKNSDEDQFNNLLISNFTKINPLPAGIGYCPDIHWPGLSNKFRCQRPNHASVVTGIVYDKKSQLVEKVQIRDSYPCDSTQSYPCSTSHAKWVPFSQFKEYVWNFYYF